MKTKTDKKKLIELLDKSEYLAGQFSGGYSGHFLSVEEFYTTLVDNITKFKAVTILNLINLTYGFCLLLVEMTF